jgi:rubrerythrin
MFTVQDILEIAIRLEHNGEKTYQDARLRTSSLDLKALLAWIAQEEQNHARWFTDLKDRLARGEDHHLIKEMSRALVEDVVQGQAFSLQEVDFKTLDTPDKMIRTFIGFEDDTVRFYEILKAFVDDPAIAGQLEQIINEEKKHMATFRDLLTKTDVARHP